LRGAGHNFGIVTEVKYKVYDVPKDDVWTHTSLIFAGTKLEALSRVFNELIDGGGNESPVELVLWAPLLLRIEEVDPVNVSFRGFGLVSKSGEYTDTAGKPVIVIHMLLTGTRALNPLIAPLTALEPLVSTAKDVLFTELSDAVGFGWKGIGCKKDVHSILRFPIGMRKFNPAAMREAYDHFAVVTNERLEFKRSFVVWEAYATQAVKAVAAESTAVADRGDNMLVSVIRPAFELEYTDIWVSGIMIIYQPDPTLDDIAAKFGNELRQIMLKGSGEKELHAYINYAHGDEKLEEIYGHEAWRLEKLRRLKREYDPEMRFRFYAPIV